MTNIPQFSLQLHERSDIEIPKSSSQTFTKGITFHAFIAIPLAVFDFSVNTWLFLANHIDKQTAVTEQFQRIVKKPKSNQYNITNTP